MRWPPFVWTKKLAGMGILTAFFFSGNVAITVEGSLVDFNARQFQDSLSSALRTRKPGEIKILGVRMSSGVVVDVRVCMAGVVFLCLQICH